MPTIERWRGYRVNFYSHEPNEPPHTHVDPVAAAPSSGCNPSRWRVTSTWAPSRNALKHGLAALMRKMPVTLAAKLETRPVWMDPRDALAHNGC